ncbi:hypothetical protein [Oceanicoccus sp. KOV_DT_Chl]|nr:hypothetical protein [Oceanicoccus sp. KOV_DT_Chl]
MTNDEKTKPPASPNQSKKSYQDNPNAQQDIEQAVASVPLRITRTMK